MILVLLILALGKKQLRNLCAERIKFVVVYPAPAPTEPTDTGFFCVNRHQSMGHFADDVRGIHLPVQPIKPADRRTWLVVGITVIRTFSCSRNGNGWAGLRTPFS